MLKIGAINVVIGDILNEKFLKLHSELSNEKLNFIDWIKAFYKWQKNAFCFTLKACFIILRYLKFCPDFYGHVRKTTL